MPGQVVQGRLMLVPQAGACPVQTNALLYASRLRSSSATGGRCGGEPAPSPDATFVVSYEPSEYDAEAAASVLYACLQLPGAELRDQAESLLSIQTLVFTGSAAERDAPEGCLRRVPAAAANRR